MPSLLLAQISIYDIQYTSNAGDGTYPSPYNGQTVTTGGIVTAHNYLDGRYFISSSIGGAWNGIFIYDKTYSPEIGDSVLLTGNVYEYNGFTELKDISSFQIISTANDLPDPVKISTDEVTSEANEGVLIEINTSNVTSVYDEYGNWWVNDGTGVAEIRPGIFNLMEYGFPMVQDYPFTSIIGVIGINYGSISVQPRFMEDIQSSSEAFILSNKDFNVVNNNVFECPICVSILNQTEIVSSYSVKIQYNAAVFRYEGFEKSGTLSESGTMTDESTEGNITLNFTGSISCNDIHTLIKLKFTPIESGNGNLQFGESFINGTEVTYFSEGELTNTYVECDIPIGDTVTIVQRPLLNIPSIVIPDQELNIECFAPESTTDWNVELIFEDIVVPLELNQSEFDSDLQKWILNTTIPQVDFYELLDLKVTASDGIFDNVTNAVKIINQFKDNYYFVHITDAHLPGHTFYGNDGYETDDSELDDFYEVIKDINLMNPEFVLLTGDLINEGELEDFECLRNHTLSVQLLEKFEVPVYIVPGNHDLGGWDATPPSQGTARREWWRFFGWRQRETPPTETEYLTHDYSFDYGSTHFTGLEAYDNYDSYMYNVYGDESFIPSQITWLKNDLQNAGNKTKVLFYHYDFKHELDLSDLGVDMALWGHTHKNSEDATHPYDISTASTCDGKRTYRVIRVNDGNLQAENPIQTHSSGDMLSLDFNMENNGVLDSISASIQNKHNQSFNNGLIKFIMPLSNEGYSVNNGTLEQTIELDNYTICYVKANIPTSDELTVSIAKGTGNTTGIKDISNSLILNYPNPFTENTNIEFEIFQQANVNLSIYNTSGEMIKVLVSEFKQPGKYSVQWDATNSNGVSIDSGIYFCRFIMNGLNINTRQMIYIK